MKNQMQILKTLAVICAGTAALSGIASAQIPAHNSITAHESYSITVTPAPSTYSQTSTNLTLNFTIEPQNANFTIMSPPFTTEIIEFHSNNSQVFNANVGAHCTRYGTSNRSLNCSVPFNMPAIDAAEPNRMITVRYFVNSQIPGSQTILTGYSQNQHLVLNSGGSGSTGGNTGGNTAPCPPETAPLMPNSTNGGTFIFNIPQSDVCTGQFFIDPPVAAGYAYTATGAEFTSVTMPSLSSVNDTDGYSVNYTTGNIRRSMILQAGGQHNFSSPVSSFRVGGINPQLALNPTDATAFATGIKLTSPTGPVTLTQTAQTVNHRPFVSGPTFGTPGDVGPSIDIGNTVGGNVVIGAGGNSNIGTVQGGNVVLERQDPAIDYRERPQLKRAPKMKLKAEDIKAEDAETKARK